LLTIVAIDPGASPPTKHTMAESINDVRRRAQAVRNSELAVSLMQKVFGITPYPWQVEVISHLLMMSIEDSGVPAAPVLLVRPTGGGKSSVRDVHGVICGGVSLTITPLLSLGADQEEKMNARAKQTEGPVVPIHLDEVRSFADQTRIVKEIKQLSGDSHATVFLFSSPQAICNKKFLWKELLHWLIVRDRLSMVTVDEVHLFVHFGLTFRKEFMHLTAKLFSRLRCGPSNNYSKHFTKIPILFMTATCTKFIVERVESMIGFIIDKSVNVFWPGPLGMDHRQVFLDVQYTTQSLSAFKAKAAPRFKDDLVEKFIVYSNTRATIKRVTPKLCDWVDGEGYKVDILSIVGSLLREQKFYHIRVFMKSNVPNIELLESCIEEARPFNPRILTATSGAANVGIDDEEVYGVCRLEFPPSCLDIKQEKGRAGRRRSAAPMSDWYLLCISLETLVVLLKRLHDTATSVKNTAYFKAQEEDIQDVLELFVLATGCLQARLELKMSNPYLPPTMVPTECGHACSHCLGNYKTMFPRLVKSGVRTVFLQLFLGSDAIKSRPTLDKELVDAVKNYPGSNRLMFGVNSDQKPEPKLVKQLLLMLLAAKIMKYYTQRKTSDDGKTTTVAVSGGLAFMWNDPTKLTLNDDSYWALIPEKE
jgi:superfamily II DNA helicase RecQ